METPLPTLITLLAASRKSPAASSRQDPASQQNRFGTSSGDFSRRKPFHFCEQEFLVRSLATSAHPPLASVKQPRH